MRAKLKPSALLFALLLPGTLAALGCTPDPQISQIALGLHQLGTCNLGSAQQLTVSALGDFPSRSIQADPKQPAISLDVFPLATRELIVDATFPGSGGVKSSASGSFAFATDAAQGGGSGQALLLPESRSCLLSDPLAFALAGAAVAALPDASLLIAGGLAADGLASSNVLLLPAGAELVQQVPDGMLFRRSFASATAATQGLVLIAGGAADDRGIAQERYEIFDVAQGKFSGERSSKKLLTGPRMEHAAVLLPDGRVLLVGGRAQPGGAPLASAELIDVSSGELTAITQTAGLVARVAPQALVLDTGEILIVGGSDATSTINTHVARFDAHKRTFSELAVSLPAHEQAVAAALAGGRVAWLGCDQGKKRGCALTLLLHDGSDFTAVAVALDFAAQTPNGLSDLHMLALRDGRLFLTGRDPVDPVVSRRAFVVDPSVATIEPRDATRVPSVLLSTSDGTLAELDAFGASLRREEQRSEYASPTVNLATSAESWLALDAPSHWQRSTSGDGLRARVAGARLELPELRFGDVRVELQVDGSALLLMAAEHTLTPSATVSLDHDQAELTACKHKLAAGSSLQAVRRGTSLVLQTTGGEELCRATVPSGPLRLALSASADTLVRTLRITRL